MAATSAPSSRDASSRDLQASTAILRTFVHLKVTRFTSGTAPKLVERSQPRPDKDNKALAKRLREALSDVGVSLKHISDPDIASRVLGYSHRCARKRTTAVPKGKFTLAVTASILTLIAARRGHDATDIQGLCAYLTAYALVTFLSRIDRLRAANVGASI